jgi:hypothetical protein
VSRRNSSHAGGSPQRGGNYGLKSAVPDRFSIALDTAIHGHEPVGASEFSRGRGLVAPELAEAPPDQGGRYRGREGSETLGDPKAEPGPSAGRRIQR